MSDRPSDVASDETHRRDVLGRDGSIQLDGETILFLIVDDEPVVRKRIRSLVTKAMGDAAYDIVDVDDGLVAAEVVKAVGGIIPMCIFLDVQMPVFDAQRFLRLMREDVPNSFVVAMSSDEVDIDANEFVLKQNIRRKTIRATIENATAFLRDTDVETDDDKAETRHELVSQIMERLEMLELLRPAMQDSSIGQFDSILDHGRQLFGTGEDCRLRSMDFDGTTLSNADLVAIPILIMDELDMFDRSKDLHISRRSFLRLIVLLQEQGYRRNRYHNFRHAIDVAQACFAFISYEPLRVMLSKLDIFTLIIAALHHDVGHVGRSNVQLLKDHDVLAMLYSSSVLESFHCSYFIRIQNNDSFSLLHHMDHDTRCHILRQAVMLILSTDMSYHFAITNAIKARRDGTMPSTDIINLIPAYKSNKYHVKSRAARRMSMEQSETSVPTSGSSPAVGARRRLSVISLDSFDEISEYAVTSYDGTADDAARPGAPCVPFSPAIIEDRLLLLVLIIKAADISNSVRPPKVCQFWSDCIAAEACLRDPEQARKMSYSFMDSFAKDLFEVLVEMGVAPVSLTNRLRENMLPLITRQSGPTTAGVLGLGRRPSSHPSAARKS